MIGRFRLRAGVAFAVVLTLPTLVRADTADGRKLAERWCAACHVTGPEAPRAVQQGPPSFHAIAQGGKSADQLRTFLAKPHGAMPDLALSRSEIDNLIAYIQTLR